MRAGKRGAPKHRKPDVKDGREALRVNHKSAVEVEKDLADALQLFEKSGPFALKEGEKGHQIRRQAGHEARAKALDVRTNHSAKALVYRRFLMKAADILAG